MPVQVPKNQRISSSSGASGTTAEKATYDIDLLYRTAYASNIATTGAWNLVYFQATDGSIKLARWYGNWSITTIVPAGKALYHTPLASTQWGPQDTFRLYYLSPDFLLREWAWDTANGADHKYDGDLNASNVKVAPYSKLSVISFKGPELRVYYQSTDNKIQEQTYNPTNGWQKGATLPGTPLAGTNLAFVNRNDYNADAPSIRGYFQTSTGGLAEQVWEVGGWGIGDFAVASAPFLTPITATVSNLQNFPKIFVYWLDVQNLVIQQTNWHGWSGAAAVDTVSVVDGFISATSFARDTDNVDVRVYGTGILNILAEKIFRGGVWETTIGTVPVGTEVTLDVVGA
ncbi:hypothetical protein TWF694_007777 [Orbilia ellipsospora]|uniref:Fucose-specific lectin n=1 Tax=Orbilia ellipsospora TaxID=2528407 RepID=A0AAV9XK92_9PEZI